MSPYELVFGHRATISQDLEIRPNVIVSRTFTDYYERLKIGIDCKSSEVKGLI